MPKKRYCASLYIEAEDKQVFDAVLSADADITYFAFEREGELLKPENDELVRRRAAQALVEHINEKYAPKRKTPTLRKK